MSLSPVEYRSVIKFLVQKKTSNAEEGTQKRPSRTTVYYWIVEFKGGRVSVEDDKEGRGRPEEIGQDKLECCEQSINDKRRIPVRELAEILYGSKSICQRILSSLGYRKVCSRFVHKFLTAEMKTSRFRETFVGCIAVG